MSHIFISYASEDRATAQALAQKLEQRGWSVWWDRDIPPGKSFDRVIEKAIESASCMIVLWSEASVDSDWVKAEAAEARERQILIPALISDVKIPIAFRRIEAADLTDWPKTPDSSEIDLLLKSISGLMDDEHKCEDRQAHVTWGKDKQRAEDTPSGSSAPTWIKRNEKIVIAVITAVVGPLLVGTVLLIIGQIIKKDGPQNGKDEGKTPNTLPPPSETQALRVLKHAVDSATTSEEQVEKLLSTLIDALTDGVTRNFLNPDEITVSQNRQFQNALDTARQDISAPLADDEVFGMRLIAFVNHGRQELDRLGAKDTIGKPFGPLSSIYIDDLSWPDKYGNMPTLTNGELEVDELGKVSVAVDNMEVIQELEKQLDAQVVKAQELKKGLEQFKYDAKTMRVFNDANGTLELICRKREGRTFGNIIRIRDVFQMYKDVAVEALANLDSEN